jgi:hypothetical protein
LERQWSALSLESTVARVESVRAFHQRQVAEEAQVDTDQAKQVAQSLQGTSAELMEIPRELDAKLRKLCRESPQANSSAIQDATEGAVHAIVSKAFQSMEMA